MTFDRISSDPEKMNGQPHMYGRQLTVRRVVEVMATYADWAQVMREYPELDREDIFQALMYAAANLDGRMVRAAASPNAVREDSDRTESR
jgi:uncharacterized protein (DUF433 family)